jgi:nitroreductase
MTHPASQPRMERPVTADSIAAVDHAITSRRSIRQFLPTPVPRDTIEDILRVASRAPSGTNTQPWQVHVLTGQTLQSLVDKIMAAYNDPAQAEAHQPEYDYYPQVDIALHRPPPQGGLGPVRLAGH